MGWVFLKHRILSHRSWFVRPEKMNIFAPAVGVDPIMCSFHSIPIDMMIALDDRYGLETTIVEFCGSIVKRESKNE